MTFAKYLEKNKEEKRGIFLQTAERSLSLRHFCMEKEGAKGKTGTAGVR